MSEPEKPLDYGTPANVRRPNVPLQVVAGCFAASALIGIAAFVAGYVSFALGYGDEGRPALAMIAFILIIGAAVVVVVIGAIRARRDPRRRGVQIGLWLGLGVGLLIAGLCFTGM